MLLHQADIVHPLKEGNLLWLKEGAGPVQPILQTSLKHNTSTYSIALCRV